MILAIEGASAAGKTTWCRSHFPDRHVPEAPEDITAPDLSAHPAKVGRFWVNHAILNWRKALALERAHGLAVCDGDPFHLYYSWALWKSGALAPALFEIESALYRQAFQGQQIGFVDQVLWIEVPEEELRRRAANDASRRRKRHEIYLALVPWTKAWLQARENVLPGSVRDLRGDAQATPTHQGHGDRYSAHAFDEMLERLSATLPRVAIEGTTDPRSN